MSSVFAESIKPGQVIAGKYRVERVLGSGGMGTVVAAMHLDLDEVRAVKLMHPSQSGNAQAVERFLREARATRRLKTEHVPMLYDVGRLESGAPYMVMEVLEGEDLRTLLKSRGQVPIEESVLYILQASEAIAEAHAMGIVHRDLKPANLFVTRRTDGTICVKVLDFGVSKLLFEPGGAVGADMTKTLDVLGSIHYMAPEQLRSSRSVDARADVFSLGVILYRLLTGRLPFQGDTPVAYIMALRDPVHPPSAFRSDLPPELDAVIMRALEKDPDRRTSSVAELMIGLIPFGPGGDGPRVEPEEPPPPVHSGSSNFVESLDSALAALPPPPVPDGYDDVDSLDLTAETQPMESKNIADAMAVELENARRASMPALNPPTSPLYAEFITEPLAGTPSNPGEGEPDPSAFVEEIDESSEPAVPEAGLFDIPPPAPEAPVEGEPEPDLDPEFAAALAPAPAPAPAPALAPAQMAAIPRVSRPPQKPISISFFILLGCLLGALAGIIIAVVIVVVRPKPETPVELPPAPTTPARVTEPTALPAPPVAEPAPPQPPSAASTPTEPPPATSALPGTAPTEAAPPSSPPALAATPPPPPTAPTTWGSPPPTQTRPLGTSRPGSGKKGSSGGTPTGSPTTPPTVEPPRSGPIFE